LFYSYFFSLLNYKKSLWCESDWKFIPILEIVQLFDPKVLLLAFQPGWKAFYADIQQPEEGMKPQNGHHPVPFSTLI